MTSRVWIEQAKGVLAATRGVDPDTAFQQLRRQARSSSRKLADLAQEAQRERIAALAIDDARSGRPRCERSRPSRRCGRRLTGAQDDADVRERAADERNHLADERERAADQRERDDAAPDRPADAPE